MGRGEEEEAATETVSSRSTKLRGLSAFPAAVTAAPLRLRLFHCLQPPRGWQHPWGGVTLWASLELPGQESS